MTYTLANLRRKAAECQLQAEAACSSVEREQWTKAANHWRQLVSAWIDEVDDELN